MVPPRTFCQKHHACYYYWDQFLEEIKNSSICYNPFMKSLSKITAHPVISGLTVLFIAWIAGNIFAAKALSGFYLTVRQYFF
jgi:hypothetical protein